MSCEKRILSKDIDIDSEDECCIKKKQCTSFVCTIDDDYSSVEAETPYPVEARLDYRPVSLPKSIADVIDTKTTFTFRDKNVINTYSHNLDYVSDTGSTRQCDVGRDGTKYEIQCINIFKIIFGKNNVSKEKEIAHSLSFKVESIKVIETRMGIDCLIWTNGIIYAIQIKVGNHTQGCVKLEPFLRTLKQLRKKNLDPVSEYYGWTIKPIWYTSAYMKDDAIIKLREHDVHIFNTYEWDNNVLKCQLFLNFTNMLLTGERYIKYTVSEIYKRFYSMYGIKDHELTWMCRKSVNMYPICNIVSDDNKFNCEMTIEKTRCGQNGNSYKRNMFVRLEMLFGATNVENSFVDFEDVYEKQIILEGFDKDSEFRDTDDKDIVFKRTLKNIDMMIRVFNKIYVLKIKTGSGTGRCQHVYPFVRSVNYLKEMTKKKETLYYGCKIIPIFYTSTTVAPSLKQLCHNTISIFSINDWSEDINNCKLFNTFIKIFITGSNN